MLTRIFHSKKIVILQEDIRVPYLPILWPNPVFCSGEGSELYVASDQEDAGPGYCHYQERVV